MMESTIRSRTVYVGMAATEYLAVMSLVYLDIGYGIYDQHSMFWSVVLAGSMWCGWLYNRTQAGWLEQLGKIVSVLACVALIFPLLPMYAPVRAVAFFLMLCQVARNLTFRTRRDLHFAVMISFICIYAAIGHSRADWTLYFYVVPYFIALTYTLVADHVDQHLSEVTGGEAREIRRKVIGSLGTGSIGVAIVILAALVYFVLPRPAALGYGLIPDPTGVDDSSLGRRDGVGTIQSVDASGGVEDGGVKRGAGGVARNGEGSRRSQPSTTGESSSGRKSGGESTVPGETGYADRSDANSRQGRAGRADGRGLGSEAEGEGSSSRSNDHGPPAAASGDEGTTGSAAHRGNGDDPSSRRPPSGEGRGRVAAGEGQPPANADGERPNTSSVGEPSTDGTTAMDERRMGHEGDAATSRRENSSGLSSGSGDERRPAQGSGEVADASTPTSPGVDGLALQQPSQGRGTTGNDPRLDAQLDAMLAAAGREGLKPWHRTAIQATVAALRLLAKGGAAAPGDGNGQQPTSPSGQGETLSESGSPVFGPTETMPTLPQVDETSLLSWMLLLLVLLLIYRLRCWQRLLIACDDIGLWWNATSEDPQQYAVRSYRAMVRKLAFHGCDRDLRLTARCYLKEIARRFPAAASTADILTTRFEQARYSGNQIDSMAREQCYQAYRGLGLILDELPLNRRQRAV